MISKREVLEWGRGGNNLAPGRRTVKAGKLYWERQNNLYFVTSFESIGTV